MNDKKQTHCKRGHLFDEKNAYLRKKNGRVMRMCKECIKLRNRRNRGRKRNRKEITLNGRKWRASRKAFIFTYYGPNGVMKCSWEGCEVTDPDMLVLDHINNNGAEHRRNEGKNAIGFSLYARLIKSGFPPGYQTLCCNHNTKKETIRAREEAISRLGY